MRAVLVVTLLLVGLSTADAKVPIPKLVPYSVGEVSVLVPEGWQLEIDEDSNITSVPPDDVMFMKGVIVLSIKVEERFLDTLEDEVESWVVNAKWSRLKGGWKCAAGIDPLADNAPTVVCALPLGDRHWLEVIASGNAFEPDLVALVKKVVRSVKGFTIPAE